MANGGPCSVTFGDNEKLVDYLKAHNPIDAETWRVYDDDGILYAEGVIIGDFGGFEPLDDYASGQWGCTEIQYRTKDGYWMRL
jgi:hypothetical protein